MMNSKDDQPKNQYTLQVRLARAGQALTRNFLIFICDMVTDKISSDIFCF